MDDEYAEDDFEASLDDAAADVGTVSSGGNSDCAASGGGGGGGGDDAPEEEVRPPASPASAAEEEAEALRQRSRALQDALAVDDDTLLASDGGGDDSNRSGGEGSHGGAGGAGGGAGARSRLKRKNPSASRMRVSGRHLLDNLHWAFSVCATRIRSLQVPVMTRPTAAAARYGREAFSPAIRELRVFATLDKQSMQSQGSEWKREPRPGTPKLQKNLCDRAMRIGAGITTCRVSPGSRRASASPSSSLLGRRSGFLDEASWRGDHGTLRWTFSTEKFRKLKASAPRVKVLVFGIGENAIDAAVRKLSEESAHAHNESIVSFGWFFLDLRTPDLPERWFKLQNSRFGGEILISTAFVPFENQQQQQSTTITGISPSVKTQGRLSAVSRQRMSNTSGQQQQQPDADPIRIPIGVGNGEYLRLGSRQGSDVFVISVFLQAAFNLVEVVERTLGSRKTASESYKGGFWLSYSLFDVVVRTDVFHNLDVSEFPPIRDSFQVMSCLQDLADFFIQQNLAVYLCTYNRVLAGVEIPFSDLLSGELFAKTKQQQQPTVGLQAVVEGNFAFPSTNGPFIDASIAVECIRTASKSADSDTEKLSKMAMLVEPELIHQDPVVKGAGGTSSDIAQDQSRGDNEQEAKDETQSVIPTVCVSVDQMRLNAGAVSKFAGEEGISLELAVGSATVSGQVRFHAFTKDHVLGDNHALQLLLRNLSFEELRRSQITVRCFSSESQRQIGESQPATLLCDRWECVEDIPGTPFGIEIPIYGAGGKEIVGQCTPRLEARDEVNQDNDGEDLAALKVSRRLSTLRARDRGAIHVFRVFLQLKSLLDFEKPQEFAITYQNPFTGKGKIEVSEVEVVKRGEVLLKDAFCVFELLEDERQFKQLMQASVAIDFLSLNGDGQRELTGSAVFSLNFLYFSQEQFCCADSTCGKTFRSQADGEAHFEEAHSQSAHFTTSSFGDGKVHLFKSCAIEIPVISVRNTVTSGSSPHRIGTVGVAAYAEDMGVLSEEDALAVEKMLVPQAYSTQRDVRLYDTFLAPLTSPPVPKKADAEKRMASTVETLQQDASNTKGNGNVSSTQPPVSSSTQRRNRQQVIDNPHSADEDEEARAREISLLKKSLEREKQLWIQEQQNEQVRWKRRLEAMEKARMNELEEEWARREEERSALLRTTQAEYERLEKALRTSLLELEARERRLAIAENALQRDQHNQKDENEHFRKRLQSDHTHALSIVHKQSEAQEKRIVTLEKQLSDAEKRARQMEADFAEYRLQQRKVPESRLREEISALKGTILELEKQKMHVEKERDAAQANCANLKLQLEKMATLVQNEKKKNDVRVAEELEKLRVKFVAREEKYVLDGDREELRAIKKQLDELKGLNLRGASVAYNYEYDPVTATQQQEHEHRRSPQRQTTQHSWHQRGSSEHRHHHHHHTSVRRTQRERDVRPLYPAQQQVVRGGRSISSVSDNNWESSQFSTSIDERHQHHHRHRAFPNDSLPPDERVRSLHGGSIRSSGSSRHYEHEGEEEGEEEIDDEGFDRYSDDQFENESQLPNANNHHHHHHELDRLERERKLLLASGAYDEQSYLVRELTRLIEITRTREAAATRQQVPVL